MNQISNESNLEWIKSRMNQILNESNLEWIKSRFRCDICRMYMTFTENSNTNFDASNPTEFDTCRELQSLQNTRRLLSGFWDNQIGGSKTLHIWKRFIQATMAFGLNILFYHGCSNIHLIKLNGWDYKKSNRWFKDPPHMKTIHPSNHGLWTEYSVLPWLLHFD